MCNARTTIMFVIEINEFSQFLNVPIHLSGHHYPPPPFRKAATFPLLRIFLELQIMTKLWQTPTSFLKLPTGSEGGRWTWTWEQRQNQEIYRYVYKCLYLEAFLPPVDVKHVVVLKTSEPTQQQARPGFSLFCPDVRPTIRSGFMPSNVSKNNLFSRILLEFDPRLQLMLCKKNTIKMVCCYCGDREERSDGICMEEVWYDSKQLQRQFIH